MKLGDILSYLEMCREGGGSSLVAENVRLLCAKHNLAKSDKIE